MALSQTLKFFRQSAVNTVERLCAVPCSLQPLYLGSNNVLKGTQDKFEIEKITSVADPDSLNPEPDPGF
jgi:hypothetical protein